MPVTDLHPDLKEIIPLWEKVTDCIDGEETVKAKGTKYLPRLAGQGLDLQGKSKYDAYLDRALYYNAPGRTVLGLVGAILRKEPEVVVPDGISLESVTCEGESFAQLCAEVADEVVSTRTALLVDAPAGDGLPFIAEYDAADLINWRTENIGGREVLTMAVLCEKREAPGEDEFSHATQEVRRVLRLRTDSTVPTYTVQLHAKVQDGGKDAWIAEEEFTPRILGGAALGFIPLVVINATSLELCPERPVLADLVNVCLSHYRNSADLEHGRHWTALPTAVACGFPTSDSNGDPVSLSVGSETAWVTDREGASASYLEFSGSGLGHIAQGMKDKEAMMAVLGARLLEEPKAAVESAETIKVRNSAERSVLGRIAVTLGAGLTKALYWWVLWQRPMTTEEDVSVTFTTEFVDSEMTAQDIAAIVQAAQAGLMSWSTAFWNLQRGQRIPDERTMEEEAALIGEGLPTGIAPMPKPQFGGGEHVPVPDQAQPPNAVQDVPPPPPEGQ